MKRRVFIAIDLTGELKAKIAEIIKQWRWLPIRWLEPENWHITLIPPVYLNDAEVNSLIAALEKSRVSKYFVLNFLRISLAPPGQPSRMIWLEGETPSELVKLKNRLEKVWSARLALPSLKEDSRPLKLHVTLARFEPGDLKELEAKTSVLGEVKFRCEVREIAVMESRLKPAGAEYETLATIAFQ